MSMTIAHRIALILAGDRSAMFARGGGGAKSSSKGGKGKGKAGKEKSKKGKGVAQSGSGGACCKAEGGKFAPGNNYGSLNRGSAKVAANKAGRAAGKAVAKAAGPARAGIAGMIGRSRQAAAKGAQVKAARDKEQAVAAQKQARNQKARERRAAKKGAAQRKPGMERMVARSKGAAAKGASSVSAKVRAEAKAAGYGPAEARQLGLAAGARAKAGATGKAFGRGTPERMARAAAVREARVGIQKIPKRVPITEKASTKGGVKTVTISRGPASMTIVRDGDKFRLIAKVAGKDELREFDSMRDARDFARRHLVAVGYVGPDASLRSRHDRPARGETRRANIKAAGVREKAISKMVKASKATVTRQTWARDTKAHVEKMARQKAQDEARKALEKKEEAASAAHRAERASRGVGPRPAKWSETHNSRDFRRQRILERAGDNLAEAKESLGKNKPRNLKKGPGGRTSADVAKRRSDLAAQVRRSRKVIQKADPKEAVRLAEGKARAERRRAQQPKLPFEQADRAAALRRMTDRSKAAVGKAASGKAGRTTAGNVQARLAAAKAAQQVQVKRTATGTGKASDADRAALAQIKAENAAKRAAAKKPADTRSQAERWRAAGIQPHSLGTGKGTFHPAGAMPKPAGKTKAASTKADRAKIMHRMVDRSKLASEVKKAEVRLRATKAARVAAGLPATPPPAVPQVKAKAMRPTKTDVARADAARKQAAWDSTRAKAEPKLSARARRQIEQERSNAERANKARQEVRSNRSERVGNLLSRAGEIEGKARASTRRSGKQPRELERDKRGRMTPEVARRRADAAIKIKRARAVAAKLDKDQQAKLAEQKARAERRRAQQPRLPFERADRAAALKRMTDRSRAAAGKGIEAARAARSKAPTATSAAASAAGRSKAVNTQMATPDVRKTAKAVEKARENLAAAKAAGDVGKKASVVSILERDRAAAAAKVAALKKGLARLSPIERQGFTRDLDAARAAAPKPKGIGGREPDLRGVAPAGRTPAASRAIAGRATAISAMVRKSREAAQGTRMVANKRAAQAAVVRPTTKAAGRGTPERMANAAATREARIGLQRIPRSAPIEVSKPATYGGRKVITVRRGAAELKVEQVQRGGKEYRVVVSYYGSTPGAPGGVGKVSRELDRFDRLADAKDYAREQIATVGSVEPGGKPRPRPRRRARA